MNDYIMEIIVYSIFLIPMIVLVIFVEVDNHLFQKKRDEIVDLYIETTAQLIKQNKEFEKSADEYKKLSCELKKAINLLEKGESNQDEHGT